MFRLLGMLHPGLLLSISFSRTVCQQKRLASSIVLNFFIKSWKAFHMPVVGIPPSENILLFHLLSRIPSRFFAKVELSNSSAYSEMGYDLFQKYHQKEIPCR